VEKKADKITKFCISTSPHNVAKHNSKLHVLHLIGSRDMTTGM